MFRMEDCQKMTEGLVFSVLAVMGLFFLALFASRRKDWYFFLVCLHLPDRRIPDALL